MPGELHGGDPIRGDVLKSTRHGIGAAALVDVYHQETVLDLLDPAPQVSAIREGGIDSFAAE